MADSITTSNSNTTGSPTNSIRNIMQTAQEREIIKTAPDIIVYINGRAYLINPYIKGKQLADPTKPDSYYTYVTFNDHVQTFQASYDVDNLIPTGSITLEVPNHQKHLYQSPGGNNLIESMMEVQVYAKGYFASGSGNTVYHRVFKGLTTNISHTDTGTMLQITVQCLGILHFLDFMFTDLSPAALSYSDRGQQVNITNQSGMYPYEQLADVFNRGISADGFIRTSLVQAGNLSSKENTGTGDKDELDWQEGVQAGYINRWQPILDNIRKEVHITGYRMGSVSTDDTALPVPNTPDNGSTKFTPESQGWFDPTLIPAKFTVTPQVSLIDQSNNKDYYIDAVRVYLPDLGIGSLQLINGRITSLIERIRVIVQAIGFEGFQDIDGTVIFKPPLYNLNVTDIGASIPTASKQQIPTSADITDTTNPFIVHLSEIEAESEVEDEQGIRATRVTIQGSYLPNAIVSNDATILTRAAVSHMDIPKMAKFGLREEPARPIPWVDSQDKISAYVYAVSELNRANRGWRTYNLTIPLRPELKLGFPMYLPHKDMYGYIKNVTISYQSGGAATMSIALDSLRKRPLFPATHTVANPDGTSTPVTIYTTQPNLVMEWTVSPDSYNASNPKAPKSTSASSVSSNIAESSSSETQTTNKGPVTTNDGTVPPNTTAKKKIGTPATQRQSELKPVYQQELEILGNRRTQWGTSWQTKADTTTKCFRIQNDKATAADATITDASGKTSLTGISQDQPFFSAANWITPRPKFNKDGTPAYKKGSNGQPDATNQDTTVGVNVFYMQKVLHCQPYTDEGGYEVMTPFPWGRWKTLKEALLETRLGILKNSNGQSVVPVDILNTQTLAGTQVFLYAGVGSPQNIDPSSNLNTELGKLSDISNFVASATSFELVTPPPGVSQNDSLMDTQPDNQVLSGIDDTSKRTDFFVWGGNAPCADFQQIYRPVTPPTNNTTTPNAVGVTPSSGSQSQTFVSKLLNGNNSTE